MIASSNEEERKSKTIARWLCGILFCLFVFFLLLLSQIYVIEINYRLHYFTLVKSNDYATKKSFYSLIFNRFRCLQRARDFCSYLWHRFRCVSLATFTILVLFLCQSLRVITLYLFIHYCYLVANSGYDLGSYAFCALFNRCDAGAQLTNMPPNEYNINIYRNIYTH